jgi:hypothetical protein
MLSFSRMAKREAVSSLDTEGKLKALDQIEKQLVSAIKNCGQVIGELGNEKISEKNAVKMTDKFIKEIDEVEGALTNQIHYLSQVLSFSILQPTKIALGHL